MCPSNHPYYERRCTALTHDTEPPTDRATHQPTSCTSDSVTESNAEVASSSTTTGGFLRRQRAMEMRCFSPPDSFSPRSPTTVFHCSGCAFVRSFVRSLFVVCIAWRRWLVGWLVVGLAGWLVGGFEHSFIYQSAMHASTGHRIAQGHRQVLNRHG